MAEHEASKPESLIEKISEKIHDHHSSSSDSDDDKSAPSSLKSKIYRLFGRDKPVHKVLGGGKRTICSLLVVFWFSVVDVFSMFRSFFG